MSAGAFEISKYETDSGAIHPIRIQPETAAAAIGGATNAAPAGAVDGLGSASVSRGRRANGINARLVRLRFTGAPPTGYLANGTVTIPALAPEFYDAAVRGAEATYLGVAAEVTGRSPETIN